MSTLTSRKAAFIHSGQIEKYHYPEQCPFKTERAAMTKAILKSHALYEGDNREEVAPIAATEDEVLSFHTPEYIKTLKRVSTGKLDERDLFAGLGTEETPVFHDLYDYAVLAAGGSITAAKLIIDGKADIAFNPSGGYHHACADKAGGFCYINDVVLACNVLASSGRRIFCLDIDAHHGNGTQEAFYSDPNVFTVSFHESGTTLYPWGGFENETGEGSGTGFNVNLPLPKGTDDDAFCFAFRQIVPPLLAFFNPDVILVEIGMDVLLGDPLTHLAMTNNAFADVIPDVLAFENPVIATGGGGYNPDNTARGWALAWLVLCGLESAVEEPLGMGGVFLGSTEWKAGLRDMRAYARGEEHSKIHTSINNSVDRIKDSVFKLHGI
jgi:acetoin utilization protein AcuC